MVSLTLCISNKFPGDLGWLINTLCTERLWNKCFLILTNPELRNTGHLGETQIL
jgi:hypothetical protein